MLGNLYSLRSWTEYGFKQVKNQLGWADFRLTDSNSIERWWEIVFSAYFLVSLQALQFKSSATNSGISANSSTKNYSSFTDNSKEISQRPEWKPGTNWKSSLT